MAASALSHHGWVRGTALIPRDFGNSVSLHGEKKGWVDRRLNAEEELQKCLADRNILSPCQGLRATFVFFCFLTSSAKIPNCPTQVLKGSKELFDVNENQTCQISLSYCYLVCRESKGY